MIKLSESTQAHQETPINLKINEYISVFGLLSSNTDHQAREEAAKQLKTLIKSKTQGIIDCLGTSGYDTDTVIAKSKLWCKTMILKVCSNTKLSLALILKVAGELFIAQKGKISCYIDAAFICESSTLDIHSITVPNDLSALEMRVKHIPLKIFQEFKVNKIAMCIFVGLLSTKMAVTDVREELNTAIKSIVKNIVSDHVTLENVEKGHLSSFAKLCYAKSVQSITNEVGTLSLTAGLII